MEKEIQDLIIKYMVSRKPIDNEYYNEIIRIYLKHHNLEGYIHEQAILTNEIEDIIAAFIPQYKAIVVSPKGVNAIRKTLAKLHDFQGEQFNVIDILQITQYLLHELEHVQQEYIIENGKDDSIEANLLKISNPTWDTLQEQLQKNPITNDDFVELRILKQIEKYNELYQTRLYSISLRERLAEVRSYKTMLNILPGLCLPEKYTEFYKRLLHTQQLRGYDLSGNVTSGPTMDYIDALAGAHLIDTDKCDIYDDNKVITYLKTKDILSLEDRIDLGLPLTKPEYEALSLNVSTKLPEQVSTQK